MKKKTENKLPETELTGCLNAVKERLGAATLNESVLTEVAHELSQVGDMAREEQNDTLQRGAELLSRVSELAASFSDSEEEKDLVDALIEFLGNHVSTLDEAVLGKGEDEIDSLIDFANQHWEHYLSLFDDSVDYQSDDWLDSDDAGANGPEDAPSDDQIKMMLAALGGQPAAEGTTEATAEIRATLEPPQLESAAEPLVGTPPKSKPFTPPVANGLDGDADAEARAELASDRELLEAYLDDAMRCLGSMEQAAMKIDESPSDHETGKQFCRELHTLKGASGTVGLKGLASQLHDLESSLEAMFAGGEQDLEAQPLFNAVDQVRGVIDSLQAPASAEEPVSEPSSSPAAEAESPLVAAPVAIKPAGKASQQSARFSNFASNDDASIRIRASKLDRLMDMLAELVVLRNRRESNIIEFNELNGELVRCATRVGFAGEQERRSWGDDNADSASQSAVSRFGEVSKDISAVSQGLRELQKPLIQDNASISRFIRDFRQELMQLRRVPVSGLFSRLQRAARDAAKSESKTIRVVLEGENAGLEQEIQERLFDSMLHVVRNSVSHGVELPADRKKAGKDEVGTITLEATSNAQLLMIEVRDDGGGIDYDAVRRRGIEKGLIAADLQYSNDQLARLIFHPGFSTREQASEVSGRGVGMDVVATTIEQMRGRIEIDSVAGQGTTMRLLIPLRTGIEHVMVFRAGGQLFALPMQSVSAAKTKSATSRDGIETISLSMALSNRPQSAPVQNGHAEVLMLRQSRANGGKESLAIAIDELVGPEEVVVRGLPNLLRAHPLMNGITLSGAGEQVLLLDADRLVEFCVSHELDLRVDEQTDRNDSAKRALVVDDSLTARKVLGKILRKQGFSVVEAGDGIEAIEKLHQNKFDLVLTDLDMPRMGGIELLTDIESGEYCDATCVIVSSRDEQKFRDQAIDVGASQFLNKPINEKKIKQLLKQIDAAETQPEPEV